MSMAAVGAENRIVGAQLCADAGRDCLLTDVGMAGAVNEAAGVAAGELLFAHAYHLHRSIQQTRVRSHNCRTSPPGCRTEPPAFIARLPPSMGISAPVIHFAESEAKNTARPWMSSGRPRRPAGIPLR